MRLDAMAKAVDQTWADDDGTAPLVTVRENEVVQRNSGRAGGRRVDRRTFVKDGVGSPPPGARADDARSRGVDEQLGALAGSGKLFIHTSGSSIVGTRTKGHRSDAIFDESSPIVPSPARAARVALNDLILSYRDKGCHPVIICPSLIYGLGHGAEPHSMQVPLLIDLARKRGCAAHAGLGENIWSNVHIDDLVMLYALAIEKAPAGSFFFAENGENSMREVCEAINRMLGHEGAPSPMSMEEATSEWGEGLAEDTMASNSRVRAVRARQLGWKPRADSLVEEIERGCYRE